MNTTVIFRVLVLSLALFAAACGGGGGGGEENVPGAPVADAGPDQTVAGGESVELYGLDSVDEDGMIVSYEWEQTGGTDVTVEDGGFGIAGFVAPPSGASALELTFRLTVVDNEGKPDTDTMTVTVSALGATPTGFARLHDGVIEPAGFAVSGGKAFFTALDSNDGYGDRDQLWATDGTSAGTFMLKEMSTASMGYAWVLTPFKGGAVFVGDDGVRSSALWFSDGTPAGTRLIKDITTATAENIYFVGVGGDYFYFVAHDGVHGRELWASDGTSAGTYMIIDRNPNGDSTVERAAVSTYWNGYFYFFAWHYEPGTFTAYPQLYRTDGTQGNLVQLTNNSVPGSVLLDYDMIVYNDRLYFTWHSYTEGNELWVTDGTPGGTKRFRNIAPETGGYALSGWPEDFHILDGKLLFFAYETGSGAHKSLYSSDGTEAGTVLVHSVDPGVLMENMVMMNGKYYFAGRAHGNSSYTLWVTDGTAGGTQQVSGAVLPEYSEMEKRMVVIGNKLVFKGTDGVNGYEPWVSDGTFAGTFMLKNIHAETGSFTSNGGKFVARGSKAYFVAGVENENFQLFETDGTAAGTRIIAPDDATTTYNTMGQEGFSQMVELAAPTLLGNTLIFNGDFHGGYRLYKH